MMVRSLCSSLLCASLVASFGCDASVDDELGGRLAASSSEQLDDPVLEALSEEAAERGADRLSASTPVSASTCHDQYEAQQYQCDQWYDVTADFACCMSWAGCIRHARWDECDCLYALGSPQHQQCYEDVVDDFVADKAFCFTLGI